MLVEIDVNGNPQAQLEKKTAETAGHFSGEVLFLLYIMEGRHGGKPQKMAEIGTHFPVFLWFHGHVQTS